MPKKPIDYSNTTIYKLCCNDPTVTDVYVGHTTEFTKRKYSHKIRCNNPSDAKYHLNVYQFIRDHGGWENWSMIEIERLSCIDMNDATKHERKHFELLGATLNCNVPSRSYKEYCLEHTEEAKKYNRQYRLEHAEEIKEKNRQYCLEHADEINEYHRQYYKNHLEEFKGRNRQYRLEHADEIKEKKRQYRLDHKDEINERKRQNRLKKKASTSSLVSHA